MEVLIPLALTFLLPLISSPGLAKRRSDLTARVICLRFGLVAGVITAALMVIFVAQASSEIGGGLGAFFLAFLTVPTALLGFALAACAALLGVAMARRK